MGDDGSGARGPRPSARRRGSGARLCVLIVKGPPFRATFLSKMCSCCKVGPIVLGFSLRNWGLGFLRVNQIEDLIDCDASSIVVVVSARRINNFSVQINHGGFFVGQGRNRSYVDGRAIWYDQVERVTWSPIMIENLVEELGYEMAGRLKVFYRVPILTLSTNGLRAITDDEQAGRMLMFLDIGHHFFSIYLDHDDSFWANLSEDDVVNHPRASLTLVFNPTRRVHSNVENAEAQAEAEHGEAEAKAEHGEAEAETEHIEVQVEAEHG